jgi:hypothetical protein
MKKSELKQIIKECYTEILAESKASEQAHKLGYKSGGKGRWYDKSGNLIAKTQGDKLVKTKIPNLKTQLKNAKFIDKMPKIKKNTKPTEYDDDYLNQMGADEMSKLDARDRNIEKMKSMSGYKDRYKAVKQNGQWGVLDTKGEDEFQTAKYNTKESANDYCDIKNESEIAHLHWEKYHKNLSSNHKF